MITTDDSVIFRNQCFARFCFKHILFHLHEKGLGRAQMLYYSPLLTIVIHVFNNVHSCKNTFTLHIHTTVTSTIPHVQNHEFGMHSVEI